MRASARQQRPKAHKERDTEKPAELLFEIGCEEIPAGMLPRAEQELQGIIEKLLSTEGLLDRARVETFSTPRRLVTWVRGLPLKQEDVITEITGPPRSLAYDAVGAPTRAAVSFAEKQRVPLGELYVVRTPKGEYLAAKQIRRGRVTKQILEEILPRAIHDLSWPRSMTWTGLTGPRFIRPIRWIAALFAGRPLTFSFDGVLSGVKTRGHRFLGRGEIPVRNFADYEEKLRKQGVILRPAKRREKIEQELAAHVRKGGHRLHEDRELLQLVTYLNEYPTVIEGDFDPSFLSLPEEILVTVMRDHQKYFALEKRNGQLAPHFLAVINLDRDRQGLVRIGQQRVLKARFADAQFFWAADQKCRLADSLPKLEKIIYESRLGTYRHKVERVRMLARWLTEQWFSRGLLQAHVADADRAAELAKCDLASEMVREFPELQGIVGGLYARAQGEANEVADAIYDHYRPIGLDAPVPRNLIGCALALADKLDSVTGCFAVGIVPTGSSDPYGLRRAALGIVKIILDKNLPVSLSLAVEAASKALSSHPPKRAVTAKQQAQILAFILDRARFIFRERANFAYDEIHAVFHVGADDLIDAQKRLGAMRAIRRSKNFEPLAVSFKRMRKIVEKADFKGGDLRQVEANLFEFDAERELLKSGREAAAKVAAEKKVGHYERALETIAGLRKPVDRFFEEVLVMAEDPAVRRNRLALLSELLREFTTIADFSELGGEEHS